MRMKTYTHNLQQWESLVTSPIFKWNKVKHASPPNAGLPLRLQVHSPLPHTTKNPEKVLLTCYPTLSPCLLFSPQSSDLGHQMWKHIWPNAPASLHHFLKSLAVDLLSRNTMWQLKKGHKFLITSANWWSQILLFLNIWWPSWLVTCLPAWYRGCVGLKLLQPHVERPCSFCLSPSLRTLSCLIRNSTTLRVTC